MTSWAYCDADTCAGVRPSVATNYVHPDNAAGQCCECNQECLTNLMKCFVFCFKFVVFLTSKGGQRLLEAMRLR